MSSPVTIRDLAVYRGAVEVEGSINGAEFDRVGLEIIGGCGVCGATLAAYNGCPSKSGVWKCLNGCIDGDGWDDVAEADKAIFGGLPKMIRWYAVIEFPDESRHVMTSIEEETIEKATERFRTKLSGNHDKPRILAVYAEDAAHADRNEGWW